ncbi:DUF1622 domain-containing protein [Micromonospora sp. NPDC005220]|uniref:DUF1622 domain-containing protein n=1 Tax=Micromonospora sp. NPDC005220 TaxID=3155589 RepID=UPI00339F5E3A
MPTKQIIQHIGAALDPPGVLVFALGVAVTTVVYAVRCGRTGEVVTHYRAYRQGVGRAILLGLEFLVGGDVIRTVAVAPTFTSSVHPTGGITVP